MLTWGLAAVPWEDADELGALLPHAVMAMMTTARRAVTVERDGGTRAESRCAPPVRRGLDQSGMQARSTRVPGGTAGYDHVADILATCIECLCPSPGRPVWPLVSSRIPVRC